MLLATAGLGISAGVLNYRANRAEEASMLKKNILDGIEFERRRALMVADGALRTELQKRLSAVVVSLDERLGQEDGITRIVDELNELRLEINRAQLDDSACMNRTEAARRTLGLLRARGIETYERELARLEAEIERIAELPAEARLLELKGIGDKLAEMENLADLAGTVDTGGLRESVYEPARGHKPREAVERLRTVREIRDLADRIAWLDPEEGRKLLPTLENLTAGTTFPDRLAQIRQQTRRAWGDVRARAAATQFFRDRLTESMKILRSAPKSLAAAEGSELVKRYDELCRRRFIERPDAMRLYEDIARFVYERNREIADGYFITKLEQTLGEIGYELIGEDDRKPELIPDAVNYLESPYEGYRVMLKVDSKGEVAARMVRTVASAGDKGDNSNSSDQEARDREAGNRLCRDIDKFLGRMDELGLPLDVSLRVAPEETSVLTVVDKKPAAARKKRGRRGGEGHSERAASLHGDAPA
jgi:hypothetical protein